MSKQEILNELAKLYCLQREGKKVKALIRELEQKLYEEVDDELDKEIEEKKKVRNG